MPDESPAVLLRLLDRLEWYDEFLFNAVDNIEAWRLVPYERMNGNAAITISHSIAPELADLCRWIRANVPTVDPTPIEATYGHIATWARTYDASRLPPQGVIETELERARIVVRSAIDAIIHAMDVTDLPSGKRTREILAVLFNVSAFDRSGARTTEFIAKKASDGYGESYKKPISDLSRERYIETQGGRSGGVWLTDKGRRVAERITRLKDTV